MFTKSSLVYLLLQSRLLHLCIDLNDWMHSSSHLERPGWTQKHCTDYASRIGGVYNAGYFRMSTWIPFVWALINTLVLILSSFAIQGGL